jgi:hypothetical protein
LRVKKLVEDYSNPLNETEEEETHLEEIHVGRTLLFLENKMILRSKNRFPKQTFTFHR